MITQSKSISTSVFWFSTLISKQSTLKSAYNALKIAEAIEIKTIPMSQGNKTSRLLAWTFLSREQQKNWVNTRWKAIL
jgi:23S rRNA (adenine1618-N6)-methyltransferase